MGLRERFKNFTNGRRAPPRAPGFLRYLTGWTITLALVFSFTGGGSDSPFALAARFGYWFIHIGTGLLAVSAVSGLLQRGPCACLPSPIQLAIYGLGGAIVFTPLAIVFETWWPVPGGPDGPPDWPMEAARDGWLRASLAEFGSLAPSFLGSWLLINLAYLVPARVASAGAPMAHAAEASAAEKSAVESPNTGEASAVEPPNTGEASAVEPPNAGEASAVEPPNAGKASAVEPPHAAEASAPEPPHAGESAMGSGLRSRLPQALGADIIHLRADLNYLHVTTAGGSAMLLYSLARAAEELGELGLVVHRAHWVACAHVARSRRTAQGLILTLSNGVDVPVSRRRQAEIRTRFGDRFQAPVTLRR